MNSGGFHISKNFGHPWTLEDGWDLIEVKMETELALDRFEALLLRDGWSQWIRDNTGKIQSVWIRPNKPNRTTK